MHKKKAWCGACGHNGFAADTTHQNQIGNIDCKMTKGDYVFALGLFTIDSQ